MITAAFASCDFGGIGGGESTTGGGDTTAEAPGTNEPEGTTGEPGVTNDPQGTEETGDGAGTTAPNAVTTTPDEIFKPEEAKIIELVKNGRSSVKIVYSRDVKGAVDAAGALRDVLRTKTGANLSVAADTSIKANSDKVEILVGYTNRPESESMRKFIGYKDYGVYVCDNKIIIGGWSETSLTKAVQKFESVFLSENNITDLSISSDSNYATGGVYTFNAMLSKGNKAKLIAGNYYYKYSIVVPADYSVTEHRFALRLQAAIGSQAGVVLDVVTDAESTSDYEILVGKTSRTTATVGKNEYKINVKDNRVELLSDSFYGYDYLYEFCSLYFYGRMNSATKNCGEVEKASYVSKLKEDKSESFISKAGDIRVIYNNVFGFDIMTTTPGGSCMPGIRNPMIAEFYKDFNADVLCFEEINAPMRGTSPLTTLLAEYGYEEVSEGKCSTPIFYNKATLERIDAGELNFNAELAGKDDVVSIQGDKYMTWAVLKVKKTGKTFGVINVHMDSFDDHGEGSGAIEAAAQVKLIMKVAADIYSQYSCAVLVGGDMNTTISEPTCQTLTQNGYADVQGIAKITDSNKGYFHGVKFMEYNEGISGAYFTGSPQTNNNYSESVDHIFVNAYGKTALEAKQFDILADASVASFADHCAMVFDFNIK